MTLTDVLTKVDVKQSNKSNFFKLKNIPYNQINGKKKVEAYRNPCLILNKIAVPSANGSVEKGIGATPEKIGPQIRAD